MTRILAKLFAVAAVLTICLPVQPSSAENVAFVSASGSGTACTQTAPCGQIVLAVQSLAGAGGRIVCVTPVSETGGFSFGTNVAPWIFDCPSSIMHGEITINGVAELKFQHMIFSPGANMMHVTGGGILIYEDCVLENATVTPLDIEPTAPFILVMKNSRISDNVGNAGVLIKPASFVTVTATFDGVTITNNAGGLRTDTTNGPVRVDISNSTINNNANNGLIAIGGAGGPNMVTVKNDVIASNGQAGIEASGATAAVLVNNTVLDSNGSALSAVSSGKILTYQNNTVVGSPGTGFTGAASPQ